MALPRLAHVTGFSKFGHSCFLLINSAPGTLGHLFNWKEELETSDKLIWCYGSMQ